MDALFYRAQVLGEQAANRQLEIHSVSDTFELGDYPPYYQHLREWPVLSIEKVDVIFPTQVIWGLNYPRWVTITDEDSFEFQADGHFSLYLYASKLRVTYQSGYDFAIGSTDPDVVKIKYAVSQLAIALDQLDKLKNPDDPKTALYQYLLPFKQYRKL